MGGFTLVLDDTEEVQGALVTIRTLPGFEEMAPLNAGWQGCGVSLVSEPIPLVSPSFVPLSGSLVGRSPSSRPNRGLSWLAALSRLFRAGSGS